MRSPRLLLKRRGGTELEEPRGLVGRAELAAQVRAPAPLLLELLHQRAAPLGAAAIARGVSWRRSEIREPRDLTFHGNCISISCVSIPKHCVYVPRNDTSRYPFNFLLKLIVSYSRADKKSRNFLLFRNNFLAKHGIPLETGYFENFARKIKIAKHLC